MSKFLINESPLVILPTLAKKIGLSEAIVLQQIQYWLSNPKVGIWHEDKKWIHNTYGEWAENFPFWSESGVKKIILRLESMGLLVSSQTSSNPYDHTKSYRIDYDKLDEKIAHVELENLALDERTGSEDTVDSTPRVRSITETTTETTNTSSGFSPSDLPVDWQIAAGMKVVQLPDEKDAQYKDSANLIAMAFGVKAEIAYKIAYVFMKTRGIVIPQSKIKSQHKAIKEMLEMNVSPEHVEEATRQLLDAGMTITDLYSVAKTAVALANPAPQSNDAESKFEGI